MQMRQVFTAETLSRRVKQKNLSGELRLQPFRWTLAGRTQRRQRELTDAKPEFATAKIFLCRLRANIEDEVSRLFAGMTGPVFGFLCRSAPQRWFHVSGLRRSLASAVTG